MDSASSEYGFCEHGNEPSESIKCGEFLDILSDYQLRMTFGELRNLTFKNSYGNAKTLGKVFSVQEDVLLAIPGTEPPGLRK